MFKLASLWTNTAPKNTQPGASPKTAIINDRILAEGETVSGWRVQRIERNRVTLRNAEGRTIQVAAK